MARSAAAQTTAASGAKPRLQIEMNCLHTRLWFMRGSLPLAKIGSLDVFPRLAAAVFKQHR